MRAIIRQQTVVVRSAEVSSPGGIKTPLILGFKHSTALLCSEVEHVFVQSYIV